MYAATGQGSLGLHNQEDRKHSHRHARRCCSIQTFPPEEMRSYVVEQDDTAADNGKEQRPWQLAESDHDDAQSERIVYADEATKLEFTTSRPPT